jgi:hypothetical protein
VLGAIDATITKGSKPENIKLDLAALAKLKGLAVGHDEYRFTNLVCTLTVVSRLQNDGELIARVIQKGWVTPTSTDMKTSGASYRYVTSQVWGVSLSGPGEWVNVANPGAWLQLGGLGLEKDTVVSVMVRGNVQFR